jgi:hypothetical protein
MAAVAGVEHGSVGQSSGSEQLGKSLGKSLGNRFEQPESGYEKTGFGRITRPAI